MIHVAARTVATHALSIFGDHSDVMHARTTGWAMLAAGSVQEAHDFALVAHAATLRGRVPFLHFFDGFRTSHEIDKIALLDDDDLRALVRDDDIVALPAARHDAGRAGACAGTAQNPDVFFQAREACNPFHARGARRSCRQVFDELGARTGRRLRAGRVPRRARRRAGRRRDGLGGGRDRGDGRRAGRGRASRSGLLRRCGCSSPFPTDALVAALPPTVRSIAVLDRTKEPGAVGEPLYLDVGRRARRGDGRRRAAVRAHATGDRRPLRPVVQGVHAGDGQGGVRRARRRRARSGTSRSGSTTTSPT